METLVLRLPTPTVVAIDKVKRTTRRIHNPVCPLHTTASIAVPLETNQVRTTFVVFGATVPAARTRARVRQDFPIGIVALRTLVLRLSAPRVVARGKIPGTTGRNDVRRSHNPVDTGNAAPVVVLKFQTAQTWTTVVVRVARAALPTGRTLCCGIRI